MSQAGKGLDLYRVRAGIVHVVVGDDNGDDDIDNDDDGEDNDDCDDDGGGFDNDINNDGGDYVSVDVAVVFGSVLSLH